LANKTKEAYEHEFKIRQKQIEEEKFQQTMQERQKNVDKLWNELNALHEKMNVLYEG